MSDNNGKIDINRRDFLRGGFLRRALQEAEAAQAPISVRPTPPVHTPAPLPAAHPNNPAEALTPQQQIELARARARAMIGVVQPPKDQKPFDVFSLLTSFDRKETTKTELAANPVTAQINPARCLAHAGSFCTVCSEHCPAEGAVQIHDHRPTIDPAHCTGCAECYRVCPAPVIAIVLSPVESTTQTIA